MTQMKSLISLQYRRGDKFSSSSSWVDFTEEGWKTLMAMAADMRSHFPDCEMFVIDNQPSPRRYEIGEDCPVPF